MATTIEDLKIKSWKGQKPKSQPPNMIIKRASRIAKWVCMINGFVTTARMMAMPMIKVGCSKTKQHNVKRFLSCRAYNSV